MESVSPGVFLGFKVVDLRRWQDGPRRDMIAASGTDIPAVSPRRYRRFYRDAVGTMSTQHRLDRYVVRVLIAIR